MMVDGVASVVVGTVRVDVTANVVDGCGVVVSVAIAGVDRIVGIVGFPAGVVGVAIRVAVVGVVVPVATGSVDIVSVVDAVGNAVGGGTAAGVTYVGAGIGICVGNFGVAVDVIVGLNGGTVG